MQSSPWPPGSNPMVPKIAQGMASGAPVRSRAKGVGHLFIGGLLHVLVRVSLLPWARERDQTVVCAGSVGERTLAIGVMVHAEARLEHGGLNG